MPHSLGHGVGLEVHEAPWLRSRGETGTTLEPGMMFTLEPGLYDGTNGGVRLENDFLVTDTSVQPVTSSRIVRIPETG